MRRIQTRKGRRMLGVSVGAAVMSCLNLLVTAVPAMAWQVTDPGSGAEPARRTTEVIVQSGDGIATPLLIAAAVALSLIMLAVGYLVGGFRYQQAHA